MTKENTRNEMIKNLIESEYKYGKISGDSDLETWLEDTDTKETDVKYLFSINAVTYLVDGCSPCEDTWENLDDNYIEYLHSLED